jgi:hypothetical protein
MKYVFVGDIHGKVDKVEEALSREGKKIFVGDFIDSFDHSVEDHKKCYDLVFDAIDKDEAQAILGNHELSYLRPTRHRCSGYESGRDYLMSHYGNMILDRFEPYLLLNENVLVSHAGLTRSIWQEEQLTLELLPRVLEDWWPNLQSPMHFIGRARGGPDDVGGMFWCDFRYEFIAVPELMQIFGHTRGRGIRQQENAFCIDCLDYEESFLEMDL